MPYCAYGSQTGGGAAGAGVHHGELVIQAVCGAAGAGVDHIGLSVQATLTQGAPGGALAS